MSMQRLFLVSCLIACITCSLYPQGAYLERGLSGFGATAGFSSNENVSGFSLSAGYSFSGVFDIGMTVARLSLDREIIGSDGSSVSISPGIAYYPLKQDAAGTPVSIAVSARYIRESYSSDELDRLNISLTADFFSFGGSVFRDFYFSPAAYFQPYAGIGYLTGSSKVEDAAGNSVSTDYTTTLFGFGTSIIFNSPARNRLGVLTGLVIDKDRTTFSMSVVYVFSVTRG